MRIKIFIVVFFIFLLPYIASAKDIDMVIGVGSEYSDNIFNSNTDKKSDLTTTLSTKILSKREELNYLVKFNVGLDYQCYLKNSGTNNLNKNSNLYLRYDINKHANFVLTDDFIDAKQVIEIENIGVVSGRNKYLTNTVSPSFNYAFSEKTSAALTYTNEIFDSREPSLIDNTRQEVELKANYNFTNYETEKDSLFSNYSFMTRHYENLGDVDINTFGFGISKVINKRLKTVPTIFFQRGENANNNSFSTIGFNLELMYDFDTVTKIGAILEKKDDINAFVNNVYKYNNAVFSVVRQLEKNTSLTVFVLYGTADYRDISVKDTLKKYSLEVSRNINKDLNVAVNYAYQEVDSNLSTNEYKKNSIGARLVYKF